MEAIKYLWNKKKNNYEILQVVAMVLNGSDHRKNILSDRRNISKILICYGLTIDRAHIKSNKNEKSDLCPVTDL